MISSHGTAANEEDLGETKGYIELANPGAGKVFIVAASIPEAIEELPEEEEEEERERDGAYLIMQGPPVSTISKDGAIIRGSGTGNQGYHVDNHMEHFYSEIPPPPPTEPCPTYKGPSLSSSSRTPYGTTYNSGSHKGTLSTALSKPGKMDDLDLDLYTRMREPLCLCTRQVTLHVIIMVVTGIVYLTIGGLAGFYIGRSCE